MFITLEPPSKPMVTEAVSAGYYRSPWNEQDYPRIQILTIDDLLAGKGIAMPQAYGTFKQAQRVKAKPEAQMRDMFGGEG